MLSKINASKVGKPPTSYTCRSCVRMDEPCYDDDGDDDDDNDYTNGDGDSDVPKLK